MIDLEFDVLVCDDKNTFIKTLGLINDRQTIGVRAVVTLSIKRDHSDITDNYISQLETLLESTPAPKAFEEGTCFRNVKYRGYKERSAPNENKNQ